jgi:ribosomal protein S18 acetylase RimI-like enzyme
MERDLPAVQLLLRRAWHVAYDDIHGVEKITAITGEWHALPKLKAQLNRPWSEFLLADTGSECLGMAYAAQGSEDFAMLHQLYVESQSIGQGIGGLLLQECFEAFPEAKAFRLEVDAQNLKAFGFYSHFGFKEISRIANCGQDGSNMPAIIMERRFS